MVDPVHLLLAPDRMDDPVQLAEILPRRAEWLLIHDAGTWARPYRPRALASPANATGGTAR
jgi:hypothetical protein